MKLLEKLPWRRIRQLESKIAALEKDPFRARNFSGAQVNRLTGDWPSAGINISSLLRGELETLCARCGDLSRNNPYARKFRQMVLTNVLGHEGIQLKNKASDPIGFKNGQIIPGNLDVLANKLIEDAFWDWGKKEHCTVTGRHSWLEVQQMAMNTWCVRGEPLWRKVFDEKRKYGFAIQQISPSRIDYNRNANLEGGNTVRMGIQCDALGRETHIWLFESDPNDSFRVGGLVSKPYAASEFVRPIMTEEEGQTRPVPPMAVAMFRAKMLDGYEEAHLVGSRGAACKSGFFVSKGDGGEYKGPEMPDGGIAMEAEPGSMEQLPHGVEFQPVDWGYPNGGYGEFVKDCLRGIAAGLGVSYNTLANDLEGVNFSSGRLGLMDEREFWKHLQSWFWTNFCGPIFSDWLLAALLKGAVALELPSGDRRPLPATKFAKFNQPCWRGRRWQWVDPTKEVNAKEVEMANYLTSPSRVIAETSGDDALEILQESAEFLKNCETLGLPKPRWALEARAQEHEEEVDAQPEPATKPNG